VIAYLGLTIALWVIWCRESVGDLIFGIEGCHFLAGEVYPVVRNDGVVGQSDI